jgi:hypothetical protein
MESQIGAGDPEDGALLANGLVEFMCGLQPDLAGEDASCDEGGADSRVPIAAASLGPDGLFGVRGWSPQGMAVAADSRPVVSNGPVDFVDLDGNANRGVWGVEVESDWQTAIGDPAYVPILIHGTPVEPTLPGAVNETALGQLEVDLSTFANVPSFVDGEIHVGVCYENDITLPLIDGEPSGNRMFRQTTALQPHQPGFDPWCATQEEQLAVRGLGGKILEFLLPRPLHAALQIVSRRAGGTSGTPEDFSRFAPFGPERFGRMAFVEGFAPGDGTVGEPLGGIPEGGDRPVVRVQALTGGGEAMELVRAEIYIAGNEGEPAGAGIVVCDARGVCATEDMVSELTRESDDGQGEGTFAEFPDFRLGKTGGYTVCVRVPETNQGDGAFDFAFEEACVRLNIRGN